MTTETSPTKNLYNLCLPKGASQVQLQDSIYAIQVKFRQSRISCSNHKIMIAITRALMVEYPAATTNAKLQGNMTGTR